MISKIYPLAAMLLTAALCLGTADMAPDTILRDTCLPAVLAYALCVWVVDDWAEKWNSWLGKIGWTLQPHSSECPILLCGILMVSILTSLFQVPAFSLLASIAFSIAAGVLPGLAKLEAGQTGQSFDDVTKQAGADRQRLEARSEFFFSTPVVLNEVLSTCTVAVTQKTSFPSHCADAMLRVLIAQLVRSGIMFDMDGENPVKASINRCGRNSVSVTLEANIVFYSRHWLDVATPFRWANFREGWPARLPLRMPRHA